jgi:hypothetical protein
MSSIILWIAAPIDSIGVSRRMGSVPRGRVCLLIPLIAG